MRKLPPLGMLRAFEAAARRLSFKDAAAELHVTPTAVSHQIKQLESYLSLKLFERGTRKVMLTAQGARLYPVLREGLDDFERALESLRHKPGGQLATLSSTVAFMARRLAPRVGAFRASYPDWQLRLSASNELVDLDGEADAAIRYGSGHYPGLVVEPLIQDYFAPVCVPALAVAARAGLDGVALLDFDWGARVRDDPRTPSWRRWADLLGGDIGLGQSLSFTDEIHAVQATLAGQGVGLLSLTLVAEELASGALLRPFEALLPGYRFDLVYSPRAVERPATVRLREWVRQEFAGPLSAPAAGPAA
ncbi:LysR substrate-binding domain-containing protein [Paucibacter sp. PLA-PC-4]|uniref:LysR substrate-binding domain-containing protein n=1 Tax=Paucibacter sp. PLA-PC-4 TaxID=2993655 RepID=UPI00224AC597|nr:LysR substrate-binding domain-containing protein [Paucibacter sp. PLA-PC-4]MCX2865796.1 LysR substrate-binding domain-containing protein [Paucibacter sp. PLA-PC-4]